MIKDNKWFSIIIWMSIVLLWSLSAYYILSFTIPFSKNIKWIENSTISYYQAYSWIEESLYFVKNRSDLITETWSVETWPKWFSYNTMSSWTVIPAVWYWNSYFDTTKTYNSINEVNPVQLEIWNNMIWGNINLYFRNPDIDNDWFYTDSTLSWSSSNPIIIWTLSSDSNTLLAQSSSQIFASDINSFSLNFNLTSKVWEDLNGNTLTFINFYNSNCNSWKSCILKLSVVNELLTTAWAKVPYVEYKIEFSDTIPLRYTTIDSIWKSYWFRKNIQVKVPQQTTNQAFDFTVFQ